MLKKVNKSVGKQEITNCFFLFKLKNKNSQKKILEKI